MSDTPRTDAHNWHDGDYDDPLHAFYDFACQLERELNAASVEIERLTAKVAQLYEGAEEQKQRIKRLEEAGDAILNANNDDEEYEAIKQWYKAKEAKP
jgi:hypothetical protein